MKQSPLRSRWSLSLPSSRMSRTQPGQVVPARFVGRSAKEFVHQGRVIASCLVAISLLACSSDDDPKVAAAGAGGSAAGDASASDANTAGSAGNAGQGGASGAAGSVSPVDGGEPDGAAGASGAAGGAACLETSPDPTACSACIETGACAAESETCNSNPDCQLYSDCITQCGDDACNQGCIDQFGGGRGDYELLEGCAYASCYTVCLEPGCPWATQDGAECEDCVHENCCTECTAAVTDQDTMAAVFCIQGCAEDTCVSDCLQKYPTANDTLTTLIQCKKDFCGTKCP
jgi:hypothetical protein